MKTQAKSVSIIPNSRQHKWPLKWGMCESSCVESVLKRARLISSTVHVPNLLTDRQTFILLLKRNTIILIAHDIYPRFIYAPPFRFMYCSLSVPLPLPLSSSLARSQLEHMAKINSNMRFIIQINVILNCNKKKRRATRRTKKSTQYNRDVTDRHVCPCDKFDRCNCPCDKHKMCAIIFGFLFSNFTTLWLHDVGFY